MKVFRRRTATVVSSALHVAVFPHPPPKYLLNICGWQVIFFAIMIIWNRCRDWETENWERLNFLVLITFENVDVRKTFRDKTPYFSASSPGIKMFLVSNPLARSQKWVSSPQRLTRGTVKGCKKMTADRKSRLGSGVYSYFLHWVLQVHTFLKKAEKDVGTYRAAKAQLIF